MQPKEYFKPADATHYLKGRWCTMYYKRCEMRNAWMFWFCGQTGNRWIQSVNLPSEQQPIPLTSKDY